MQLIVLDEDYRCADEFIDLTGSQEGVYNMEQGITGE